MSYKAGPVILKSQDKNRMLDFLSDVLEFDVDHEEDSVNHGSFLFKFSEKSSPEPLADSLVEFSFQVKSISELEEIARKYNFFIYRKPSPINSFEDIVFSDQDNKKVLTIVDIDRRLWRFEFLPSI